MASLTYKGVLDLWALPNLCDLSMQYQGLGQRTGARLVLAGIEPLHSYANLAYVSGTLLPMPWPPCWHHRPLNRTQLSKSPHDSPMWGDRLALLGERSDSL